MKLGPFSGKIFYVYSKAIVTLFLSIVDYVRKFTVYSKTILFSLSPKKLLSQPRSFSVLEENTRDW